MIEYCGKQIPQTLPELVKPSHTALLVVDIQNEFCVKDGRIIFPEILSRLKDLVGVARQCDVMVLHMQDTIDYRHDSAPRIRNYMRTHNVDNPHKLPIRAVDGTWGHKFVDGFGPVGHEPIIKKYTSSAFKGTSLDMFLRNAGIKTTVIAGVVTHGCVWSTARDASYDYFAVVVSDCVASQKEELHEASLRWMKLTSDVADSEDIARVWREATDN